MALNVTKILFRRGTDTQRKTVNFDFGEPAWAYDVKRLFIGDGITAGGVPLSMRNFGRVANLSGTYLNTRLSETAFNILTAGSVQTGDIIYDATTSYIWTLTGNSSNLYLSSFAPYAVYPEITTADFYYNGTKLTLKNNCIKARHIDPSSINTSYLQGGNGTPITITPGTLINSLLYNQTPANSIKANPTNGLTTPTDLVIGAPCQVAGRGSASSTLASVTLTGTGAIRVDGVSNQIRIFTTPALALTGGTMTGGINMGTNAISATNYPNTPKELTNKDYVDRMPIVQNAQIVYNWTKGNFATLSGATMTGNLAVNTSYGASPNRAILITDTGNWLSLHSNSSPGAYNPLVQSVDKRLIFSDGTKETGNLVIGPWSDSTKGIRITDAGFVGIGDATPKYELDVAGDIQAQGWLRTTGSTGWYSQTYQGGWHMTDSTWIRAYNGKSVWVEGAGAVLGTAGKVGIGTTIPSQKLDVQGSINYTGQIIKQGSVKPPNWGGGVTTFDVYSDKGTIGAGVDGTIAAYMNSQGAGYFNGTVTVGREIIGKMGLGDGQMRYVAENTKVGVFQRNDGSDHYLLKTPFNDPYGSWDGTRPFSVNLTTGNVSLIFGSSDGSANVGIGYGPWSADRTEKLNVAGNIKSSGYIIAGTKVNYQTVDYTLAESDCGGTILMDGPNLLSLRVPSGLRGGFQVTILRLGVGDVQIRGTPAGGGPAIKQAYDQFKIAARYSAVSLINAGGYWVLFGDLKT